MWVQTCLLGLKGFKGSWVRSCHALVLLVRLQAPPPPPPLAACLVVQPVSRCLGMQVMPPSKTSFELVSIARGNGHDPGTLLRMSQGPSSITLVLRQVHAVLCPNVTLDQFRLTASKQRQAAIKTLEGPDCLWIFKYGATGSHSHKVNVISLATAIGACKAHGVQQAALSSLERLRVPGTYTILQTPEHILSMNCTPEVNPTTLLVPLPLPSTLPKSPILWPAQQAKIWAAHCQAQSSQGSGPHPAASRAPYIYNHSHPAQQKGATFTASVLAEPPLQHMAIPWLLLEVDGDSTALLAAIPQSSPCGFLHELSH